MVLLVVASTLFSCFSKQIKHERKPNILFILVDDLGWSDTGFMGSPVYETPNLDKLAIQSVVFSNGYAPAANCAPSRACILTGKNTPRHGIYTVGSSERGKTKDRKLVPTINTETLNESFVTLAEVLKNNGYTTGTIGKWHLSDNPLTQGFDVNIAGSHAGHPKSYFSPYKNSVLEDGEDGEYLTDRLTEEAVRFISHNKETPFFLYLPYFTVHTPLQGKEALVKKYKAKLKGDDRFNAKYGAMVESMDENVGKLLNKLDELGISDNTLVIFSSDNGGLASVSSQFPIRAGKGSYYEGGIRVPFVVRWPNEIQNARIDSTAVSGLDIFPTVLDIINEDNNYNLDGASILSLLTENKPLKERSLFWHFPIYLQSVNPEKEQARDSLFRTRPGSAMRKGKWKLHEYFEDGEIELYNLETDIREHNNLFDEYPEKVKELYDELQAWRAKTNAPVPTTLNPNYNLN
ncbi:sulfatase [Aestuariivivens marinum]|uniref:sulfatase n=1 Tax=Aestuariivivens marinum TaxID=2913555 RepID=UPI001F55D0BC|nr:sulfatase [Aestuariivivens marinum]